MTSVTIVSDSTTWTPATSSALRRAARIGASVWVCSIPSNRGMRLCLDLLLVLVDHLAVGRGGLGVDGRLGQHGADGLDRLAALVHLLEGLLGVVGVDRVTRLVDVLEDLGHQQRDLPLVLLAQRCRMVWLVTSVR